MNSCPVSALDLWMFSLGRLELDEHVAECDDCQERLAELWAGTSPADIAESVVARLRPAS